MTRQGVFDYVREQYGTEPDYPWFDDNAVLRHKGTGKWYGVVLLVSQDRLGLEGGGMVDVLNVKSDPLLIGALRNRPGFHPAYHMNKENWISIRLDGSAPDDKIRDLIDMSFGLTAPKRSRKRSC